MSEQWQDIHSMLLNRHRLADLERAGFEFLQHYLLTKSTHIITTPNLDFTTVTVGVAQSMDGQMYDVSIIRVFHYSEKSSVLQLFISSLPPTPGNH